MDYKFTVDIAAAQAVALLRQEGKEHYASRNVMTDQHDELGVMGELAFAEFSGIPIDASQQKKGDNGVDFHISLTVDVKCSSSPRTLYVSEGKVRASLYVLAYKCSPTEINLLGWMWGYKVVQYKPQMTKYDVMAHSVPAGDLHSMSSLRQLLNI